MPNHYCPTCRAIHGPGTCPVARKSYETSRAARRGTRTERGYTTAWTKAATAHRRREPLCRLCYAKGLTVAGECVDHIVPHNGDPVLFWDSEGNWQTLCLKHHAEKTRAEQNAVRRLQS